MIDLVSSGFFWVVLIMAILCIVLLGILLKVNNRRIEKCKTKARKKHVGARQWLWALLWFVLIMSGIFIGQRLAYRIRDVYAWELEDTSSNYKDLFRHHKRTTETEERNEWYINGLNLGWCDEEFFLNPKR